MTGGSPVWLTGWGDEQARPLLVIPPLFAEMNRCRKLLSDVCIDLIKKDFSGWVIDLPGMGESEADPDNLTLRHWHQAVDEAADQIGAQGIIALRGGAILGQRSLATSRWTLAAMDGPGIIRELLRLRLASDRESGASSTIASLTEMATVRGIEIGGYWLSPALFSDLQLAVSPDSHQIFRAKLATAPVDGTPDGVIGEPLWRRAEPGRSLPMAQAMAISIAAWFG